MLTRRKFLSRTAATVSLGAAFAGAGRQDWFAADLQAAAPVSAGRFGFSLYGMKSLLLEQAIDACAKIGYDCIELPTMADWPAAPEKLSVDRRKQLSQQLSDRGLRLSALMENILLLAEEKVHQLNVERLRAAGALGRDLSPQSMPVIETIMGGNPMMWESVKQQMVDRLGDWAKAAEETKAIIAIKAHVAGAAHLPEHIRWLLDQIRSPWIKAAFDFSHFQLRGVELKSAWEMLATDTVFIHIKDSIGDLKKFQFVLPGEGSVPYADYFKMIASSPSKADVVVEVSGQLHNRADYEPLTAAQKAFDNVAPHLRFLAG